jgi:pimeloyl-ACP methyl ester carboxylesterase
MSRAVALASPRPPLFLLGVEPWRAALEFLSHKLARTLAESAGDGHPVVIFPGLATDGSAVAPLREYCVALGYSAFDWGRGFNTGPQGDLDAWLADLATHVSALLDRHAKPATLIGWSLGGLYARELGKLLSPRLRQVITIATPFNALADHTHAGWLFRLLNGSAPTFDEALSARLRRPPPVPTTSIYSKSDGVVAWQACRHATRSKLTQDIEVSGSHIGMSWNRAVLSVIADRLAQAPGQWRRYQPQD